MKENESEYALSDVLKDNEFILVIYGLIIGVWIMIAFAIMNVIMVIL